MPEQSNVAPLTNEFIAHGLDGVQMLLAQIVPPPTVLPQVYRPGGYWPMMSGDRWGPGNTGSHGS
jgi:hypothetical protein